MQRRTQEECSATKMLFVCARARILMDYQGKSLDFIMWYLCRESLAENKIVRHLCRESLAQNKIVWHLCRESLAENKIVWHLCRESLAESKIVWHFWKTMIYRVATLQRILSWELDFATVVLQKWWKCFGKNQIGASVVCKAVLPGTAGTRQPRTEICKKQIFAHHCWAEAWLKRLPKPYVHKQRADFCTS